MVNYGELVATPNTKLLLHLNGNSTDSSGNGNNGTDTNITYVNGVFGQCASFNGSSSTIGLNNRTYGDMFTISGWFSLPLGDTTTRWICGPKVGGSGSPSIHLNYSSGWGVSLDKAQLLNIGRIPINISSNIYFHLVITYDGTNFKAYKDGKYLGVISNAQSFTNNSTFGLGNNSSQFGWNGNMDEVIIENRAWSSTEVLNYYNQSKGVYAPKLT